MTQIAAQTTPVGTLGLHVVRGSPSIADLSLRQLAALGLPRAGLGDEVNDWKTRNLPNFWRGLRRVGIARALRLPHFYGALSLKVLRGDGDELDLGLVSLRVVTTAGVTKIVDFLRANDTATGAAFKYHGLGTGTGNEASSDTTLGTELTTEYVGNTRATGSQTNNGATVYETVGTVTLDSGTPAVTEHGVFSAASSGTLLDRTKFAAINLVGANADAIQATYDLTVAAGS